VSDHESVYRTIRGIALGTFSRRYIAMDSHELLKDLLKKTSAKQVCADMGLSLSLIYKWAEPPAVNAGSGAVNPLDRVDQLLKITKDERIAHWVAERAGGFYIKNPAAHRDSEDLIPSTNAIVQQFADMLGIIASAAADQKITAQEAAGIRAQWERLKSVTEGFVQAAENGNFSGLREDLSKPNPNRNA
jgi:hypothetical protein